MKSVPQRRIVKSPFTKEERNGVFITREESRNRRNKLKNSQLFTELSVEVSKLSDDFYSGLVVVHPDDVQEVFDFIYDKVKDLDYVEVNHKDKSFKTEIGYSLRLATVEGTDWQFNHAGMQYTSVIISIGAFGKVVTDLDWNYIEYIPVSKNPEQGIAYMISRLRSNSEHGHRLVVC